VAYIGKSPSIGSYSMLDNLTASATASYSLTLDSVAFVPESANHLIVSLNGVIQKAGSSFTVSGSTLTFSSTLASSDSIDFVLALGNVLDIGTPSDATVTNAKTNFVSTSSAAGLQIKGDGTTDGTLQLNCSQNSHGIKLKSPSHGSAQSYTLTFPTTSPSANKFLKTDGSGNLSFADAGLDECSFRAYQSSSQGISNVTSTQVTLDTEDWDTDNAFASSTFTCPSDKAGKYIVVGAVRADPSWATTNQFNVMIFRNGASNTGGFSSQNIVASKGNSMINVSIVNMSAGDTLKLYLYHDEGGSESLQPGQESTYFAGTRITS